VISDRLVATYMQLLEDYLHIDIETTNQRRFTIQVNEEVILTATWKNFTNLKFVKGIITKTAGTRKEFKIKELKPE
jgi:hypothetical protein